VLFATHRAMGARIFARTSYTIATKIGKKAAQIAPFRKKHKKTRKKQA
jgi:hypothetical protein